MNITAVLITKEKVYPQAILDSLPAFSEVLIETECPNILRRYELALKAKNNLIYIQDDDCIVDVTTVIKAYDGRLTNLMKAEALKRYGGTGITLVGWGCMFDKKMVNFDKYLNAYGASPLFLSQADRVFAYLNQPFNSILGDIKDLPSASAPGRMSTSPDHWDNLNQITLRLQNL